ncbi:hypothetical protein LPJ76_002975 [Coemansia sp. RSA 638]|nr:hypothetical protein LPJ76_002975 [Coemansia sp. RSA 638]
MPFLFDRVTMDYGSTNVPRKSHIEIYSIELLMSTIVKWHRLCGMCFARAIKRFEDKEIFIKLDDDALVDIDYVIGLIKKYQGYHKPIYISDHERTKTRKLPDALNNVMYGNGKFYMFNRKLAQCLKTDIQYRGSRNEDSVFGAMVTHGCGEANVEYVQEDDRWIWHKEYTSKNKHIDLAFIKNH